MFKFKSYIYMYIYVQRLFECYVYGPFHTIQKSLWNSTRFRWEGLHGLLGGDGVGRILVIFKKNQGIEGRRKGLKQEELYLDLSHFEIWKKRNSWFFFLRVWSWNVGDLSLETTKMEAQKLWYGQFWPPQGGNGEELQLQNIVDVWKQSMLINVWTFGGIIA